MIIDKILLFPYYLTLVIRNKLYDNNYIKSFKFDIPVICVGNITAGGTGKTPMVEMLVRMLKDEYKIGVVSRGYKRKSKGYLVVNTDDSYTMVGDEPLQIKRKFPDIIVAVDSSRKRAIEKLLLLEEDQRPNLIILDDAFQYREIKADLSIVLIDYSRPIFKDHLIPFGHLRDLPSQIKRADLVIVTKANIDIETEDRIEWRNRLHLSHSQPLFFSRISYETPLPVFKTDFDNRYLYSKSAILFTGIANDSSIRNNLVGTYKLQSTISFSDHHDFSQSDIKIIEDTSNQHPTSVIMTTEKDAQRICENKFVKEEIKSKMFYLPIKSEIIPEINSSQRIIYEEFNHLGEQQIRKHIIFAHFLKQLPII